MSLWCTGTYVFINLNLVFCHHLALRMFLVTNDLTEESSNIDSKVSSISWRKFKSHKKIHFCSICKISFSRAIGFNYFNDTPNMCEFDVSTVLINFYSKFVTVCRFKARFIFLATKKKLRRTFFDSLFRCNILSFILVKFRYVEVSLSVCGRF